MMDRVRYSLLNEDGPPETGQPVRRKQSRSSFLLTLATIISVTSFALLWIAFSAGYLDSKPPDNNFKNKTLSAGLNAQCTAVPDAKRHDCWPQGDGASQSNCEAKGCCWRIAEEENRLGNVPWCYYPSDYSLYTVTSLQKSATGYFVKLKSNQSSGWPGDITNLDMDVLFESVTRLRFKIYDPNNQRYEVPIPLSPVSAEVTDVQTEYSVDIPSSGPFYITVTRKSTGKVLFSTKDVTPLVFSDQFIQIGTKLSSPYIYGLGEHRAKFLQDTKWSKLVFWARDQPPSLNSNLYGVQPFYINAETDNNVHGVFLLNSNAMGIELQPAPSLAYMTTGGILDFFVFTGPTADNVVQQFTELVGRPFMPPYWSLGFHLCRWGYIGGVSGMKTVIQRMRDAKMPFDTVWNDIDYMKDHLDWTYDSTGQFQGLPAVVKDLHDHGQHYMIIIDPAISSTQQTGSYPPYDEGLSHDVFIKTPDGSSPLIGKVWPGLTAFPDFFHPNAQNYWTKQANEYYKQIPYDGLWIDMNEPSNFLDGSTVGCPSNSLENPPYVPKGMIGGTLRAKTVCASAKQHNNNLHYNVHSLYGYSEAKVTKQALDTIRGNKRNIVISRSTYPGIGIYSGHWLGDNNAKWEDLYYSISGVLNFQLFGIPMVGSDICGFNGNTNPELCARWMQLGVFYPFMRSHNTIGNKDQDPAVFDNSTKKIMRDALNLRYSLLPYLYTLFYKSHTEGSPIVRPLFFQYPAASAAYDNDVQFMWGSTLLVTPTTSPSTIKGQGFLPQDRWYDFYNQSYIDSPGHMIMFDLPQEKINVQIRGGSILPMQTPNITTTVARKGKFSLVVALASDAKANGELFWDDGESSDAIKSQKYNLIQFNAEKGVLSTSVVKSGFTGEPMILGSVSILGVEVAPTSMTINGAIIPPADYQYRNKAIYLENQSIDLLQPLSITWLV